jgi:hypothetical protein
MIGCKCSIKMCYDKKTKLHSGSKKGLSIELLSLLKRNNGGTRVHYEN